MWARTLGTMTADPTTERPELSVVIPMFDEQEVLPLLAQRLRPILDGLTEGYEVVCVDDGSRDLTPALLHKLARDWPQVRVVRLRANARHQAAISAGLPLARGDYVVTIDAALQDPPDVVLRMIEKWRAGYEVVYAVRTKREGETKFKLWTASAFYRLIRYIADVDIPLDAGDFRLMDRRVVLAMRQLREKNRFMRGLSSWVGYKQVAVEYQRAPRFAGETHYPFRKMLKLAINAITSFSPVSYTHLTLPTSDLV